MSLVSQLRRWVGRLGTALTRSRSVTGDDAETGHEKAEQPAVKSDSAGPPRAEIQAAIERIRRTSRGIVAGFAAVAAVVVGTAPLDKIGELDGSGELVAAGAALLVVFVGIAVVISQAAAVDAPVGASPEQLKLAERGSTPTNKTLSKDHDEIRAAAEWIKAADLVDVRTVPRRRQLRGAVEAPNKPITYLANARDTARDQSAQGQLAVEGEKDPAKRLGLQQRNAGREARLKRLDEELTYVVGLANYHRLNSRFDVRKKRMILAAMAAALGIVVVEYLAHREEEKATAAQLRGVELRRAVDVSLDGASLTGARLTGADLRRAHLKSADLTAASLVGANLDGADLTNANLSAADLTGATGLTESALKNVTWISATCPDGTELTEVSDTCATKERLTPSTG